MATRRHERSLARAHALQLLYGSEVRGIKPSELMEDGGYFVNAEPVAPYGVFLLKGVEAHQEELDGFLASTSDHWSVSRMPIVDRSILRLAAFEMLYSEDVPISVAINEAVELARRFGGEDESPRFVNGVLGRIADEISTNETAADAPNQPNEPMLDALTDAVLDSAEESAIPEE